MNSVVTMPRNARHRVDQLLECAVILNWDDFADADPSTLVHIEYERNSERPLTRVKVWSSTVRGVWTLICEYRRDTRSELAPGLFFGKGFASEGLATMLGAVIRNQSACLATPETFRSGSGLVQVGTPTPEARAACAAMMRNFLAPQLSDA